MDHRHADLHRSLQQWLPVALPLLKQRWELAPLDSTYADLRATRYFFEIADLRNPLGNLPETRDLLAVAATIPQLQKDTITSYTVKGVEADYIDRGVDKRFGHFLHVYLGDDPDWEFDPQRFQDTYADFEQVLFDVGQLTIRGRLEIWNVQLEANRVVLAPGVLLRSLTEEEKLQSASLSLAWERFRSDREPIPVPETFVEIERRAEELLGGGDWDFNAIHFQLGQQILESARAALLGLRLLSPGDIALGVYFTLSENRFLSESDPTSLSALNTERTRPGFYESAWDTAWNLMPYGPRYMLTQPMADDLVRLWPKLPPKHPKLKLPLRRFEQSYDRDELEDQLIDYWVALEGLFHPEHEQEIAHKASQRIAQFIEKDGNERVKIFRACKKSYGIRSSLVHGTTVDSEQLKLHHAKTADWLRRAFRKCLDSDAPPHTHRLDDQLMLQSQDLDADSFLDS